MHARNVLFKVIHALNFSLASFFIENEESTAIGLETALCGYNRRCKSVWMDLKCGGFALRKVAVETSLARRIVLEN